MRILIADDDPKVRSALALLLDQEPGFDVIGAAENATELQSKILSDEIDLILLDWELPGLPAEWMELFLRDGGRRTSVVAMSGRAQACRAAESSGADAFVSKGDPPERLIVVLNDLLTRWRCRDCGNAQE